MSLQSICLETLDLQAYVAQLVTSTHDLTTEITWIVSKLSHTQLGQLEAIAENALQNARLPQAGNVAFVLLKIAQTKLQQRDPFFRKIRVVFALHSTGEDVSDYGSCIASMDLPADKVLDADHQMLRRLTAMPFILWDRWDVQYGDLTYTHSADLAGLTEAITHGLSADSERLHSMIGKIWDYGESDTSVGRYEADKNRWKENYDEATVLSSWWPDHDSYLQDNGQDDGEDSDDELRDGRLRYMRTNPVWSDSEPYVTYILRCLTALSGFHDVSRYTEVDDVLMKLANWD